MEELGLGEWIKCELSTISISIGINLHIMAVQDLIGLPTYLSSDDCVDEPGIGQRVSANS